MNFNVYTTDFFEGELKRLAKKYSSIRFDFQELADSLKADPKQGQPIGNDCYKIRMAVRSKGKGKSGGSRVITCVKVTNEAVYLLSIYDKSEKESVSDNELDKMLKMAGIY